MIMSESDIWPHKQSEALQKPSFINTMPPQLSENSASWLIERLKELSSPYSSNDLDSIFNMFEGRWIEFTEIEAEEELEALPENAPALNGIIGRFDYKYGAPSKYEQVVLEDKESLKAQICGHYDDLYPSSLDRFRMLLEFTDWEWTYTTEFEDKVEVEPYEVAIVVAAEMLGFYLQSLLHKAERDHSGLLAFDLDEVHQAHHLAYQLRSKDELKSTIRKLEYDIPKKTISERAAKGGKARAVRYSKIKEHITKVYESRKPHFDSIRHASLLLACEAEEFCKQHKIDRLAPANAQRTIYEWLRKHEKQRNM